MLINSLFKTLQQIKIHAAHSHSIATNVNNYGQKGE